MFYDQTNGCFKAGDIWKLIKAKKAGEDIMFSTKLWWIEEKYLAARIFLIIVCVYVERGWPLGEQKLLEIETIVWYETEVWCCM